MPAPSPLSHTTPDRPVELPIPDGWEFGDFAYGLEVLVLPDPPTHGSDDAIPPILPAGYLDDDDSLHQRVGSAPATPELAQQLFWFRWITGHQATFAIWQLLAHAQHQTRSRPHPEASLTAMSDLTRAFTALLLYTSSCPKDVYDAVIRPSMFLQHRGFSGTWAPDFVPVRGLLRGRNPACQDRVEGRALTRDVALYRSVHSGIAAKLVDGGRSLLQDSSRISRPPRPQAQALVYDNYFLTLRAPVPLDEAVDQLRRRLRAVRLDVATNGLYPGLTPEQEASLPEELQAEATFACEADFLQILRRVEVMTDVISALLRDSAAG